MPQDVRVRALASFGASVQAFQACQAAAQWRVALGIYSDARARGTGWKQSGGILGVFA